MLLFPIGLLLASNGATAPLNEFEIPAMDGWATADIVQTKRKRRYRIGSTLP